VMPELPQLCAELEQRFGGSRFQIGDYADYVRSVGDVSVPAWTGELLGSRLHNVLRGVNSARLYIKQANERAEQQLLAVETLAALRVLLDGTSFPSSDLRLAWRELLRCHPHDTICGCSCDEVHRDALVRYASLDRMLSVLQGRAVEGLEDGEALADEEALADGKALADEEALPNGGALSEGERLAGDRPKAVSVVNSLPFRRRGLIEPAGAEPVVVELDGFAARTVELAPARTVEVAPAPMPAPAPAGRARAAVIENDSFRVQAAPNGTLTVLDKRRGRRFEQLHLLEDELDMGDLYNFCPVDGAQTWRAEQGDARVLADGPLVSELAISVEVRRPAGLDDAMRPLAQTVPLRICTVVRLVRGSRRVEFRTTIDNPCRDHRLRVLFPVGLVDGAVRAEGQFAVVERLLAPAPPRTEWVEPPDRTQHTLGAVALGPLALLTKGLPEYEALADGGGAALCLTLLRSVGVISRSSGVLATRPLGAGPAVPTPEGQCLGRHELEYALLTDADDLDQIALLRESQDYRRGWMVVPAGVRFEPRLELEGNVVFSCLKGAENGDGLVLRCFNPARSAARARVVGDFEISRTRLDETEAGEQPVVDGVLELKAGEIATLRLRFPRPSGCGRFGPATRLRPA